MNKGVLMTLAAISVASAIAGTGLALAQSPRGVLSDTDSKFVMEAAESGQMEVELGQLAQQKASSDAVKQFGQRMANRPRQGGTGAGPAGREQGRGASEAALPQDADGEGPAAKAPGSAFDREYVKMMVKDHEEDVAAFKRESQQAQDPDLRAWVTKTVPTLEDHLKSIKQIESQVARQ